MSIGSDSGPEGVIVSLYKDDSLVQTTKTDADGSYVFTPLSSGVYTVVASHPTWTLLIDRVGLMLFFVWPLAIVCINYERKGRQEFTCKLLLYIYIFSLFR